MPHPTVSNRNVSPPVVASSGVNMLAEYGCTSPSRRGSPRNMGKEGMSCRTLYRCKGCVARGRYRYAIRLHKIGFSRKKQQRLPKLEALNCGPLPVRRLFGRTLLAGWLFLMGSAQVQSHNTRAIKPTLRLPTVGCPRISSGALPSSCDWCCLGRTLTSCIP